MHSQRVRSRVQRRELYAVPLPFILYDRMLSCSQKRTHHDVAGAKRNCPSGARWIGRGYMGCAFRERL